jgi:ribosome-associated protein
MPRKPKKGAHELLIETITQTMEEKKGKDITILDFRKLPGRVCDAFVVCHGTSRTQVEAIADYVTGEVKKSTGLNPWHQEGYENAEWILIDYSDVVVHIFQQEPRKFYNLEQLWADAVITKIRNQD